MSLRFVLLFALSVSIAHAQPAWTITRAALPSVTSINGVAYGHGRFALATSGPGTAGISWSTDAQTWQGSVPLRAIGGGLLFLRDAFYCVTMTEVHRSADAVTWERVRAAEPGVFHSGIPVSDGNGLMLITTSADGTLLLSHDLVTWQKTAPLPGSGQPAQRLSINHAAYGAGAYFVSYFISSIENPAAQPTAYAASTTDGTAWTLHPSIAFTNGMAGRNDRLVAFVGEQAFVTTDGQTFATSRLTADVANPAKLLAGGGRFFSARSLHSSVDGLTWTTLGSSTKTISSAMWAVAYGNGRYVAGGFDSAPGVGLVDVLAIIEAAGPPLIARHPVSLAVVPGERATFSVAIENVDAGTTFQWRLNGTLIPGATAATYSIATASPAHAGRYTVDVRNALGAVTSAPANLLVVPVGQLGRIVNLSVLTSLDSPGDTFRVGVVVGGAGTLGEKAILVRAGGPSLARFGVDRPNADPKLELFGPAGKIGENDQWGGSPALMAATTRVGAFPFLAADSSDAAYLATNARGDTTVTISANSSSGMVIAEIYDATPGEEFTAATPRLVNVSVLKPLAGGGSISLGFVIGGLTPQSVLIRAIGPALAAFNVDRPLANPRLTVVRTTTGAVIASNDDWAGRDDLRSAMQNVGAFPLSAASRDATLLLTLEPGNYSAQAFSDAAGGAALVEIYEVPSR